MKHDTFDKYPADSLELPSRALLTTWDCLPEFRSDLVLVGGLAIRHLTKPPTEGVPGAVTLDVDFGVNFVVEAGAYPGIRENMAGHGFKWQNGRFTRRFPNQDLHIDLLTDDNRSDRGSAQLDDGLQVSIFPGISRALECHREVVISDKSLLGVPLTHRVKIAEGGPLLVLKLNAFGGPFGRKAPKDAHDILYLGLNYLAGTDAAIASFHEEQKRSNRGVSHALKCLSECFSTPDSPGPVACAAFQLNNRHFQPHNRDAARRIRQQCVTLAKAFLG